jgi:MYXO-CTERM domain-containing protein
MKLRTLALTGAMTILSSAAHAHFNLLSPPASSMTSEGGKGAPPCGPDSPSANPMKVQGGHLLPIKIVETIMHPGHYRIALAMNSPSELPKDPPVVAPSNVSMSTTIQMPAVFPVLVDGVFAHNNGAAPLTYQMDLMLPNITCTKCTLQVIEFMRDHGPNPGGGYFYHHCADLQITADPALPSADGGAGSSADASADARADAGAGRADSSVADTGATGTGGAGGSGGTGGAGGSAGSGGAGGTSTGGMGGAGGGGTGGTGGGAGGSGGSGAGGTGGKSSSGGCAVGGGSSPLSGVVGLGVLGMILVARRKRRPNRQ